uniref:ATPase cation transporting 13A2 n=1 Tax=Salvator merianae TaxID=96440 RepID=A0A8D0BJU2_SALMN
KIYGPNLMDVPVKSYIRLLVDEVLNPFYIFQIFSVILWFCDAYYFYAGCIIFLSALSIGVSLYVTKQASAEFHSGQARPGQEMLVSSADLVPGDCIILAEEEALVPCDAVLLTGECLVNESMLTGESVPEMKTPLPEGPRAASTVYSPEEHRRHTLFCGTQVVQARSFVGTHVLAVVTRTGFCTAKGELISSILCPKPVDFKFYKDAGKFVAFLAVLALIGTGYSIYILMRNRVSQHPVIIRALDIVTVVVPPALPAAMTVGSIYAQKRLKRQGIFCISPPRINLSGKIRLVCFDKVRAEVAHLFGTRALAVMKPPPVDEQPCGTRQTLAMAVVHRFPFSSSLQRMSVLVKPPGRGPLEAYMKGAPEVVAGLCKKESVPADFAQKLHGLTHDGFRVLGLAYKPFAAPGSTEEGQEVTRDAVEREMVFLGFLVMKNVLKPETAPVIRLLHNAKIQTVMVTGDNMLTALNVARSCQMVEATERVVFVNAALPSHGKPATLRFTLSEEPAEQGEASCQQESCFLQCPHLGPFALNGHAFAVVCKHFPDLLPKVTLEQEGGIKARTRLPTTSAVDGARVPLPRSYLVAMCGDGANDCGALKTADVGISLSDAEASVVSPFTSKRANIECVPTVIREGRCSLVTSFAIFKYMAFYSLVQFFSVLLLYTINTNLSDLQFLFFDLAITTTVAALMGKTSPAEHLGPKRPQGSLLSAAVLSSLLLQTALVMGVQVTSYFITVFRPWFVPLNSTVTAPENLPNYENTVVFCISGFQYLILAAAVSKGHPFRKPLYTNKCFFAALTVLFALMIWFTMAPGFMRSPLKLKDIGDVSFQVVLLGMAALNFVMAFIVEFGLDNILSEALRKLSCKKTSRKLFKRVEQELSGQQAPWPPLDQELLAPTRIFIPPR